MLTPAFGVGGGRRDSRYGEFTVISPAIIPNTKSMSFKNDPEHHPSGKVFSKKESKGSLNL